MASPARTGTVDRTTHLTSAQRGGVRLLAVFSLMFMVITCLIARFKLLSLDELFTLNVARLPSLSALWAALENGPEAAPPLHFLAERASCSLMGESNVAIRLPTIVGFLVMCICLYAFVRRHSRSPFAWTAAIFPLTTYAYTLSYEGKPYTMWMGWCGLALVSWQVAADSTGWRRILALGALGLSLAAGVSTHWYSVVIFIPLALGELARSWERRHLDLPVWFAFGAGVVPLPFYLPLIEHGKQFSKNFWAKSGWYSIPETYYLLLRRPALFLVPFALLWAVAVCLRRLSRRAERDTETDPGVPFPHEIVAAIGFVLIPVFEVVLAQTMTGGFRVFYAMPTHIGFSLLLAYAAQRLSRHSALPIRALPLGMLGYALVLIIATVGLNSDIFSWDDQGPKLPSALSIARESAMPIVISDNGSFVQYAHYWRASDGPPFTYIIHSNPNEDTTELCMRMFRPWCPYDIEEFEEFVGKHKNFYLLVQLYHDLYKKLKHSGAHLELKYEGPGQRLYLVSAP
jgi:hypothetical protein